MLLKIGSTGEDVKKLQTRLGLKADGSFGAVTEAKVKAWQKANGLKADGVIGDISWAVLFPATANSGTPETGTNNLPVDKPKEVAPDSVSAQLLLKIGSTGEDVKKLQTKLGLKADGSFGAVTEAKVKAWQQANGLKADGIISAISWAVLFPATANSSTPKHLPFDKLKGVVPDSVLAQLPDACTKFEVNSILRLAHFMAQCAHESAEFKFTDENLNYSAEGLKKIFPKYFPGNLSSSYARNPKKIGARVYANRMGNGDEASGEGYHYRGRGYIQLTGKNNYRSFAQFIGEDTVANPDLVANKYPLASAAFFFAVNKLWDVCDQGASDAVVTAVTKRVNGGTIGLADRLAHFKKYYACLTK